MQRTEWLKQRLNGIGGSDASAILGLNPYMSNIDLWKLKTGRLEQKDISEKEVVVYGVAMEPVLIDLFKIDNPNYEVYHKDFDLRFHREYDFLFASLDAELTEKETKSKGVLEIKTCLVNQYNKYNWTNKIPDNYFIQVLHQMLCTNADYGIIYPLIRHQNTLEIKKNLIIKRTEVEDQLNYLLEKELIFWNENVLKDKQPNLLINL